MLDKRLKTLVFYVNALKTLKLSIHLNKIAQIFFLLIKKITILDKYSDFKDLFSKKKFLMLLE